MKHNENSVEYRPVVINKSTYDLLLKTNHPADSLALYNFYYYTAIWQETNQARATDSYCMRGLKMGRDRFRRAKKTLLEVGLIQAIKYVSKERKFEGNYIKVNYYAKKDTVTKAIQSTSQVLHLVENQPINAYRASSLNAYKDNTCMEVDKSTSPRVGKMKKLKYENIKLDNSFSNTTSRIIDLWFQTYTNKYHKQPVYTMEQWEKCATTIEAFVQDKNVEEDNAGDIVTGYFNTTFNYITDDSLLHFASTEVLNNRFYEYVYR